MEDSKEYKIVSKKDLIPTLLLEIRQKANEAFSMAEKEGFYYKVYRACVEQQYLILSSDIARLSDKEKKEFVLPKPNAVADKNEWYELDIKLWNLAREIGHVGTKENKKDFEGLINTLKEGIIVDGP
jgi:hypothetical protein